MLAPHAPIQLVSSQQLFMRSVPNDPSAVDHEDLLRISNGEEAMGENVVPARAGKVNEETKFALNHFHVEQPLLITDLYRFLLLIFQVLFYQKQFSHET